MFCFIRFSFVWQLRVVKIQVCNFVCRFIRCILRPVYTELVEFRVVRVDVAIPTSSCICNPQNCIIVATCKHEWLQRYWCSSLLVNRGRKTWPLEGSVVDPYKPIHLPTPSILCEGRGTFVGRGNFGGTAANGVSMKTGENWHCPRPSFAGWVNVPNLVKRNERT